MLSLEKAKLYEIKADEKGTPKEPGVDVQFNPQTLKLTLGNKVEGGDNRQRGHRQYLGKTSTTLSFDLHFDTADEGTADEPVSVRSRTREIEKFVLPKGEGNKKQKPPRVRFHWGDLTVDGIIEDVSIDFDLFAANGTPLRAKMTVSIKEQDAKYRLAKAGSGANTPAGATNPGADASGPGGGGARPGSAGGGPTDSTALALEGESAADFAARVGLDPGAWRGVAGQLGSTLSLRGGAEIDFNASLSAGAGIGVSVGLEAGLGASLEASFGLEASAEVAVAGGLALGGGASAGFALSAAGGVAAALETVAIVRSEKAAAEARQAFSAATVRPPVGLPAPASAPAPARPEQPRSPLSGRGFPSRGTQQAAPSAPPPPLADPRSTSFGFGVPLRPRVGGAADVRAGAVSGRIPLKPHGRVSDVLAPQDPTTPPWVHLPIDPGRQAADDVATKVHRPRPCGCGGGCGHAGGAA